MSISFRHCQFMTSAPKLTLCPDDTGVEVAFAGRSNAGKSSAINTLTCNKKMARTSKTPGRTQLINFFSLSSEQQRLVDLPGYGYAKVPLAMKQKWQKHLQNYLTHRNSLQGLILLMDIRQPFQPTDEMLYQWCIDNQVNVHILLTKADKLKPNQARATYFEQEKKIGEIGFGSIQLFSALKKQGLQELEEKLNSWLTVS